MIPMKAIREHFGVARRLTPATFYSALVLGGGTIHYYFRSVRGVLPDLLTTSDGVEDSEFAIQLLDTVASSLASGMIPPIKTNLTVNNAYGFDSVVAVPSPYHDHLKGELDEKHLTLVWCVPIHTCEFTGQESADEYRVWQRQVRIENWNRQPYPIMMLEFVAPSNNISIRRYRTSLDGCIAHISNLREERKGFVKVTNYLGIDVGVQILNKNQFQITMNSRRTTCAWDDLVRQITAFVTTNTMPV